jgi:ketosteroid isomerase-like protein
VTRELPRPVQAILDAANRGDAPAFLAAFTPDGVVDDWGREFRGAAAIGRWSDGEFIGVAVELTVEGVQQDGNRTIVTAQVGGHGFTGPSHFAFETEGDFVSRMTIRE